MPMYVFVYEQRQKHNKTNHIYEMQINSIKKYNQIPEWEFMLFMLHTVGSLLSGVI